MFGTLNWWENKIRVRYKYSKQFAKRERNSMGFEPILVQRLIVLESVVGDNTPVSLCNAVKTVAVIIVLNWK